ncbi:MAG: 2,3-diphosphoglycerate-dependent phosphoglycerate mutase [Candidatus Levyibacteriota bacterium]|nr:MAG: 2,3-diphosphoglycerate-dependent phosphoglycerate mutase [Candidatus Levybacteria bacterium]
MAYLILVRHGESEWNAKGLWTGLTDIGLSQKGKEEAKQAAQIIKDLPIDEMFTSKLCRAIDTGTIILDIIGKAGIPIFYDKALNERDYGDFTGKNKWEIQQKVGENKFLQIRRSFDFQIPNGESLKQVYERVIPYYKSSILPKLKSGTNILISAHGNSLRALIKYLENISDIDIPKLELPTGGIYVYQIGQNGEVANKQIR